MKRYCIQLILGMMALLPFGVGLAQSSAPVSNSPDFSRLSYQLSRETDLSPQAIKMAFAGYQWALQNAPVKHKDILTIVDFSVSSAKDRLYVVDLKTGGILISLPVTHGVNSGKNSPWATRFSNNNNSLESSIGVFLTKNSYYGHWGFSMRIDGLEPSNDNVLARNVVVHSANYASREFIRRYGMAGNTWGCFAVDPKAVKQLIGYIQDGSVMYAYGRSSQYMASTQILSHHSA